MTGQLYPADAVLLAPIAGHSDVPMRLSARRNGCFHAFTEMVDAGSLVFGNQKTTESLIARDPSEPFLGIQLVGSEFDILKKAAEIINQLHFDVLDFNLGCPAPKVAKKGEGASFALHRPDEAIAAFSVLKEYAKIPVTAKMRILEETDPEPTVRFARRLEDAGASAITIHGRIMPKFYSGPVHFHVIRAVREAVKIPVIANGGALTPELYAELLHKTGCTRGMIARGALGNPWIFREIREGKSHPPTVAEFADEIQQYMDAVLSFYGEENGFKVCRKTLLAFLRGRGYPGSLRASVSFLNSKNDFDKLIGEIRKGPSPRYYQTLAENPSTERKLVP